MASCGCLHYKGRLAIMSNYRFHRKLPMPSSVTCETSKDMGVEDEKQPSLPDCGPDISRTVKIMEVFNADYALALSVGPQLSPTSLRSLQLYLILLVSSMASLSFGFNDTVIGAMAGLKQYLEYFHIDAMDAAGGAGTGTSLIIAMSAIGGVTGAVVAGPMADQFGRRGGMFFGSLALIIGAVVMAVARSAQYLIGGRFFIGFGVTITTTAASTYVVEMSPPQWRGRLAGLYNTFYFFGSIMCVIIVAHGQLTGSTSWRVPLAVQVAPPGILAALVFLVPESPRWLVSVGRKAEARRILAKYHGNEDENAPLVVLEWKEIEETVKLDASDKRWWDYSELFGAPNRGRFLMMNLMAAFGQRSGGGSGYFLPALYNNAGAQTREHILILNFANLIIATGGALIGSSLVDKVGRRVLWFWGALTIAATFAIVTGCVAKWGVYGASSEGSIATIAFMFLLGFVSCLTYYPLQVLYPAECLNYNTRAKGMACYSFIGILSSMVGTYAGPIALEKIGWKFYMISAIWEFIICVIVWFHAVETGGRTLEELNEVFEDPHRVKASILKHKVAIVEKAYGTVVVSVGSPGEEVRVV